MIIFAKIVDSNFLLDMVWKAFADFASTPTFWLLLALLVAVTYLKSKKRRIKGWVGEAVTKMGSLDKLNSATYRCYHDLYLPRPDGKGTTQIDHVVVSKCGVFVIETKNFSGWIFAGPDDPKWTQQHYKKRTRIDNPLHQNRLHVRALKQFLGLADNAFIPIVWMAGDAVFKTAVPSGVLMSGLGKHIISHTREVLNSVEVDRVNAALKQLDQSLNRKEVSRLHNAQWAG